MIFNGNYIYIPEKWSFFRSTYPVFVEHHASVRHDKGGTTRTRNSVIDVVGHFLVVIARADRVLLVRIPDQEVGV